MRTAHRDWLIAFCMPECMTIPVQRDDVGGLAESLVTAPETQLA